MSISITYKRFCLLMILFEVEEVQRLRTFINLYWTTLIQNQFGSLIRMHNRTKKIGSLTLSERAKFLELYRTGDTALVKWDTRARRLQKLVSLNYVQQKIRSLFPKNFGLIQAKNSWLFESFCEDAGNTVYSIYTDRKAFFAERYIFEQHSVSLNWREQQAKICEQTARFCGDKQQSKKELDWFNTKK